MSILKKLLKIIKNSRRSSKNSSPINKDTYITIKANEVKAKIDVESKEDSTTNANLRFDNKFSSSESSDNDVKHLIYNVKFASGYVINNIRNNITLTKFNQSHHISSYFNRLVINNNSIREYSYVFVDNELNENNSFNLDVIDSKNNVEIISSEKNNLSNECLRRSIYSFLETRDDEFNVLDIANWMDINEDDENNVRKIKVVIRELLVTNKVVTVGRLTYISKMKKSKEDKDNTDEIKKDSNETLGVIVDNNKIIEFWGYFLKHHNETRLIDYFNNGNKHSYSNLYSLIIWNHFYKYEKREIVIPVEKDDNLSSDFDDFDDLDNLLTSDLFEKYFNDSEEVIDFKNNDKYIAMMDNDPDAAISNLVKANSRLVWKTAKKYKKFTTSSYSLEDMFIEGEFGLMKAIKKFDPSRGTQFSTYAVWWIRQAITREIPSQSLSIRLPVHMYDSLKKMNAINNKLYKDLSRNPLNEEISAEMEVNVDKVLNLKKINKKFGRNIISLDKPLINNDNYDSGELTLERFIENKDDSIDKIIDDFDLKSQIHKILNRLDDKERKILCLRYGIGVNNTHTLQEVGELFGVTRERIRQIEAKTLEKINQGSLRNYIEEWNN